MMTRSTKAKKMPSPMSVYSAGAGLTRKMGATIRKAAIPRTNRCCSASSRPSGLMAMD